MRTAALDGIEDGVGTVGFVSEDVAGFGSFEQRQHLGHIVRLSGGEDELDRAAAAVNGEVDLGA